MIPRRRWFQFRLRTLLILIALLSLVAVGVGQYREWRRRERGRIQFEQTLEIYDPVSVRPERVE